MNTSKEKNLKDEIVATRANYDTAVNAAKALDAVKAIDDDCCTADYEKATEAAKDIDAARESARNDIREALCAAALDAYNDYTAVNAAKALDAVKAIDDDCCTAD